MSSGATWPQIETALRSASARLEARIAGTAGDGGPACASVKPPAQWALVDVRES